MENHKIIVEKNKYDKYQISVNGAIIRKKYDTKIEAMQYAIKLGKENPFDTDVIIKEG